VTDPSGATVAPKKRRGTGRPAIGSPLGGHLRSERERLGLSLRELARRLDVSPSLVSQIETGKIQPSVGTLYAMVSELGISFDDVFAAVELAATGSAPAAQNEQTDATETPTDDLSRVQRAGRRRVIELESGVRWERLTTWNDRDVDFLYASYEVGGASSPEGKLVRHSGREFGIVITGRLGVTVGFEDHVLGPGDSISFESTIPHRLHNEGDEVVNAIWVVLGRHHQQDHDETGVQWALTAQQPVLNVDRLGRTLDAEET
jgi:transcriptional regulator with XRE-family HTH domain